MHPEVVSATPGDCPDLRDGARPGHRLRARRSLDGGEDRRRIGRAERRVFAEQVRAAAWLGADGVGTAVLYKDDLAGLAARREHTLFFGGAAPNMGIDAHLLPEPPSSVDASTVKVRFRLDPGASEPARAAGDVGSLQIAIPPRELLVVPSSAVLYSAQGPYVLAAAPREDEVHESGSWRSAGFSIRATSASAPARAWARSSSCRASARANE